MGTQYNFYTQIKLKEQWICVNPLVPKYDKDGNLIKYKLAETYWNGSRSYFSNAFNKFRELGFEMPFSQLDKTIKNEFNEPDDYSFFGNEQEEMVYVADYSKIKSKIHPSLFESSGMVLKSDIFRFEKEGEDIYDWLTLEDFKELPGEAQALYAPYHWDALDGWHHHFKEIVEKVENQLYMLDTVNALPDDIEVRLVCKLC
jgi:hypothetical protein